MQIEAYAGLSPEQIHARRSTSRGKPYSLDHPEALVTPMRYKGVNASGTNRQGWERNAQKYFRAVAQAHPEIFSEKNKQRIQNGIVPKVDKRFAQHFPQYAQYKNQRLVHHHIGRDGQAAAVPNGMHRGQGEIHAAEDALGVTKAAEAYSAKCAAYCRRNPAFVGKTAAEFQAVLGKDAAKRQSPQRADSRTSAPKARTGAPAAKPAVSTAAAAKPPQQRASSAQRATTGAQSARPGAANGAQRQNAITSAKATVRRADRQPAKNMSAIRSRQAVQASSGKSSAAPARSDARHANPRATAKAGTSPARSNAFSARVSASSKTSAAAKAATASKSAAPAKSNAVSAKTTVPARSAPTSGQSHSKPRGREK